MKWLFFVAAGAAGGVLAGMGMGGGTLTIPLLVLVLAADQITAQFANLIAFLPTGAAALGVHIKNGLVDPAPLPYVLVPALIATAATSFFAVDSAGVVGRLYGGFLVIVAVAGLAGGALKGKFGKKE